MGFLLFFSTLTLSLVACKQRPQSDQSTTLEAGQRIEVLISGNQSTATIIDGMSPPQMIQASDLFSTVNFVPPVENGKLPPRPLKGELFLSSGVNQFTGQVVLGVRGMLFNEHNWSMVFLVDRANVKNSKLVQLYNPKSEVKQPEPGVTNPFALITKMEFKESGELWVTHKSAFGDGDSPFHETVKFDKNLKPFQCLPVTQDSTEVKTEGICFDSPRPGDF